MECIERTWRRMHGTHEHGDHSLATRRHLISSSWARASNYFPFSTHSFLTSTKLSVNLKLGAKRLLWGLPANGVRSMDRKFTGGDICILLATLCYLEPQFKTSHATKRHFKLLSFLLVKLNSKRIQYNTAYISEATPVVDNDFHFRFQAKLISVPVCELELGYGSPRSNLHATIYRYTWF